MKKALISILTMICMLTSCQNNVNRNNVELIKAPISVGLGTLDISFNLPVPLYRTENDSIPFDTLSFEQNRNGSWSYKTRHLKSLEPYIMFYGDSDKEAQGRINGGLVPFLPQLAFRVLKENDSCYCVVVNEKSFETVIIRKNPDYDVLPQRGDCFGVDGIKYDYQKKLYFTETQGKTKQNTTRKYYKGYYVYETWEHLLKRALFVGFNDNYAVYDAPEGEKIFENTNHDFIPIPYKVTEVRGNWIKVKKFNSKEFNTKDINNAEGWVIWKNDKEMLVSITEDYAID